MGDYNLVSLKLNGISKDVSGPKTKQSFIGEP